jgi:hypothetical protein
MTPREFTQILLDNLSHDGNGFYIEFTQQLIDDAKALMAAVMADDDVLMPSIYADGHHSLSIDWEYVDFSLSVGVTGDEYERGVFSGREFYVQAYESPFAESLFCVEGAGNPPVDFVKEKAKWASALILSRNPRANDGFQSYCQRSLKQWMLWDGALFPATLLDRVLGPDWRDEPIAMNSEWDRQHLVAVNNIGSSIAEGAL